MATKETPTETASTSAPPAPSPSTSSAPAVAAPANFTVIVKAPSGKAFPVTLSTSATLADLARKVAADPAIGGVALARLAFAKAGKPLEGPASTLLSSLGIGNEATVSVHILDPSAVPRGPEFELMVKLPSGKCSQVKVASTDDIATLRRQVATLEGCRVAAVALSYRGAELADGTCCGDAGLAKECIVKAAVRELPPEPVAAAAVPEMAPAVVSEEERAAALANFADGAAGKKIEIVFAFDTTGSMYSCLASVRKNIEKTTRRLFKEIQGIRIGIMAVGDFCDAHNYVVSSCDITDNADQICKFVREVSATGGGDCPEAYELALQMACTLSWTAGSSRALVMIGDSPPHPPSYTTEAIWWKDELDKLVAMGVKVYGVQALDQPQATPFYRELAQRSGAIYLRFENFSLITDMFLAVCYRESTPQKLAEFTESVREEGRMTADTAAMLETLARPNEEKKAEKDEEAPPKYTDNWWDRRNDHGSPQYKLVDGKWVGYYEQPRKVAASPSRSHPRSATLTPSSSSRARATTSPSSSSSTTSTSSSRGRHMALVVIGDEHCGRSSLIQRFVSDSFTEPSAAAAAAEPPADGPLEKSVLIDGHACRMHFEKASSIDALAAADGVAFTFAVNNQVSFESLEAKLRSITVDIPIAIIATKADIADADRKVTRAQGESLAAKLGVLYIEVSAKTGANVAEAFTQLGSAVVRKWNAPAKHHGSTNCVIS